MAKLGNVMRFYIKIGGTLTWLTGEQTNSFNQTAEAIEVSDKSTKWAQFISGKLGATADVTVFADNTDAAQKAALAAFRSGTPVEFFNGTLGSNDTPSDGDAGQAIITQVGDTNDFGAVSSRSLSLTATGDVTHYPDPGEYTPGL